MTDTKPVDGNRGRSRRAVAAPSLSGDLAEFRAFDICQLLSMTGATGVLRVRAPGVRGEIFVDAGRVVGVRARPHPHRLGTLLCREQVIAADQLHSALAAQNGRRPVRLGEVLVARGLLSAARLQTALMRQAEGALTALLILPAGRFAFSEEALPGSLLRLDVDPQRMVLDALARIDELRGGMRDR